MEILAFNKSRDTWKFWVNYTAVFQHSVSRLNSLQVSGHEVLKPVILFVIFVLNTSTKVLCPGFFLPVGYGDGSHALALRFLPDLIDKSEVQNRKIIMSRFPPDSINITQVHNWKIIMSRMLLHTWSARICRCDCASSSSLWACCLANSWNS